MAVHGGKGRKNFSNCEEISSHSDRFVLFSRCLPVSSCVKTPRLPYDRRFF